MSCTGMNIPTMPKPEYRTTRDALRALGRGNTVKGVLYRLADRGIKAKRGGAFECLIAEYLRVVTGKEHAVDGFSAVLRNSNRKPDLLPKVVREAVNIFDSNYLRPEIFGPLS